MNISFILNGEDVTIRTNAERRLSDILRSTFKLLGTKTGCLLGQCGSCSVLLNQHVVKSCLIPAFKVRGCEIVTIEGFSQTEDYRDITAAFAEAGVKSCSFCKSGKILAAEALLSRNPRPSRKEILSAFEGIKCRCTEPEGIIRGIIASTAKRRWRPHGRSV